MSANLENLFKNEETLERIEIYNFKEIKDQCSELKISLPLLFSLARKIAKIFAGISTLKTIFSMDHDEKHKWTPDERYAKRTYNQTQFSR